MTDTALFSLLLILVAPVVGSFLGVVIDRLPRGISVVAPRSACRSCGTILGARDLVPGGTDGQFRRGDDDGFWRGHSLRS